MNRLESLEEQIQQLRQKWPQAHYEDVDLNGQYLILLPGMKLKGFDHNICTALFLARIYEPCATHSHGTASPLNGFFVDIQDLRLEKDKSHPRNTRNDVPTWGEVQPYLKNPGSCGYGKFDWDDWNQASEKVMKDPKRGWGELRNWPQWKGLTRFFWKAQMYDPNHDTLFTAAMLIRQRLQMAV